MTTSTDVANEALQECLARATIASFQERSKEARAVAVFYNNTRDAMLRAAPWNFARAMSQLTLLKAIPGTPENPTTPAVQGWQPNYPPTPWFYSYAQPSDCIRMRYVMGQLGGNTTVTQLRQSPYMVASDTDQQGNAATVVLTNMSQALAVYTRRIVNEDLWDAQFHQAFVKSLASRLVMPLAGDKALAKSLQAEAKELIMAARISDGNENTTLEEHLPDWLRIRGVGALSSQWGAGDGSSPGVTITNPGNYSDYTDYSSPAIPDFEVGYDSIV